MSDYVDGLIERTCEQGLRAARRGGAYLDDARSDWLRLQGIELTLRALGEIDAAARADRAAIALYLEMERCRRQEVTA